MKKVLSGLAAASCLALAACSTPPVYESVSVRIGDLSCTERVHVNDTETVGGVVTTQSDLVSTTLRLGMDVASLTGPPAPVMNEKRCQEALEIGLETSRIEQKIRQQRLEKETLEVQLQRARLTKELEALDAEYRDLATDW